MSGNSVVLGEADDGRRVEAPAGQKVVVRLGESPTTGYRWAVERVSGPLELSGQDFEPPDQRRLGAGGTRVLTFTAQDAGTAEVSLALRRAGGTRAAAKFEFVVEVTDR